MDDKQRLTAVTRCRAVIRQMATSSTGIISQSKKTKTQ